LGTHEQAATSDQNDDTVGSAGSPLLSVSPVSMSSPLVLAPPPQLNSADPQTASAALVQGEIVKSASDPILIVTTTVSTATVSVSPRQSAASPGRAEAVLSPPPFSNSRDRLEVAAVGANVGLCTLALSDASCDASEASVALQSSGFSCESGVPVNAVLSGRGQSRGPSLNGRMLEVAALHDSDEEEALAQEAQLALKVASSPMEALFVTAGSSPSSASSSSQSPGSATRPLPIWARSRTSVARRSQSLQPPRVVASPMSEVPDASLLSSTSDDIELEGVLARIRANHEVVSLQLTDVLNHESDLASTLVLPSQDADARASEVLWPGSTP